MLRKLKKRAGPLICLIFVILCLLFIIRKPQILSFLDSTQNTDLNLSYSTQNFITIHGIQVPAYQGKPWISIHQNVPFFTQEELDQALIQKPEIYQPLDRLHRATGSYVLLSANTLPADTETRESLSYKPTGWKQEQYSFIENGGWLYNRCHLAAYSLTGIQELPENLITGTRQMNIRGMLPFEIQVLQYIERYNGQCLYRVTPYYQGDNLVASGVLMECYSYEIPEEATFCVFVYNVQDGVYIDYHSGESRAE